MVYRPLIAACLAVLITACSDSSDNSAPDALRAEIRRTEYGIPHVTARDWRGLGYGFGYAYAQDRFCTTMRQIVLNSGRSAELMGAEEGDTGADFLSRFINGDRESFRREVIDKLPPFAIDVGEGFTAGMNRYLEETGVANLPDGEYGCRNAPWVQPFDSIDYWMFLRKVSLWGSSDQALLREALTSVTGPSSPAPGAAADPLDGVAAGLREVAAALNTEQRGSNGLAFGGDVTRNGRGLLLGNPHQPWFGDGSFYTAHLTIPGTYDAAGAVLSGTPIIAIGFNKDLAWTHTVSYANRFTLYELALNPDNPLQYEYDGAMRDIEQQTITIQVKQADGTLAPLSYTFYTSHFGPILNLGNVVSELSGWPMVTGTVLAMRDGNLETGPRFVSQWAEKATATRLSDYIAALDRIGNPVFHDIAADRHGDAFYGEISAIPYVTAQQIDDCTGSLLTNFVRSLTGGVILALDGSRSECEWGEDPDAPAGTNLYSAGQLPQIRTRDYVGNSNNSYWLSDANNPLEGFPSVMGPLGGEREQQFLRTRTGHLMVQRRRTGDDDLGAAGFDPATLKGMMYNNRVYGADLVIADIQEICATPAAAGVQAACAALAAWDRKVDPDSRGAQVFTEFWQAIRDEIGNEFENVVSLPQFWRIKFNANDPLNTPAGIDTALPANRQRVIDALTRAQDRLTAAGVPLDAPWGEVHFLQRNEERVPIHGGPGTAGIYGAVSASLSDGGYVNPRAGNSYLQVVTWDDSDCPLADTILVPSQSTDPTSPHYADQTKLYAAKQWVDFPFCDDDIAAQQVGETLILEQD